MRVRTHCRFGSAVPVISGNTSIVLVVISNYSPTLGLDSHGYTHESNLNCTPKQDWFSWRNVQKPIVNLGVETRFSTTLIFQRQAVH